MTIYTDDPTMTQKKHEFKLKAQLKDYPNIGEFTTFTMITIEVLPEIVVPEEIIVVSSACAGTSIVE